MRVGDMGLNKLDPKDSKRSRHFIMYHKHMGNTEISPISFTLIMTLQSKPKTLKRGKKNSFSLTVQADHDNSLMNVGFGKQSLIRVFLGVLA